MSVDMVMRPASRRVLPDLISRSSRVLVVLSDVIGGSDAADIARMKIENSLGQLAAAMLKSMAVLDVPRSQVNARSGSKFDLFLSWRRAGSSSHLPFMVDSLDWPGLGKLVEEIGEMIQVAGQMICSQGMASHFSGADLRSRMAEEMGDVAAAMDFVVHACGLSAESVRHRWHHDGGCRNGGSRP